MAPPRAAPSELGGSATAVRPAVEAGEDSSIWETCWGRLVKVTEKATVTETVTQRGKLIGVTETCTSETGREVTELTGTREMEERLHGGDGVGDAHTHIELARDDEGECERVETRCGQLGGLLRERRETLCPLEATHDQAGPVVPSEVEGKSAANGCMRSLGVWRPRELLWRRESPV